MRKNLSMHCLKGKVSLKGENHPQLRTTDLLYERSYQIILPFRLCICGWFDQGFSSSVLIDIWVMTHTQKIFPDYSIAKLKQSLLDEWRRLQRCWKLGKLTRLRKLIKLTKLKKLWFTRPLPKVIKNREGTVVGAELGEAACRLCMELQECSFLDSDVAGVWFFDDTFVFESSMYL